MNIDRLRDSLEFLNGELPYEALDAAVEQREAVTPILLDALEQAAGDPEALLSQPDDYFLHIFAMYLLAQFREPRALAPLLRLVSCENHGRVDALLGDIVSEDLHAILASVCAGDATPLRLLANDRRASPYVRAAALGALVVLHVEGVLAREAVIADLRGFHAGLVRADAELLSLWGSLVLELYPDELLPELKSAIDEDRVDPAFLDSDDVEYTLSEGRDATLAALSERYRYMTDAITRLEKWLDADTDLDELDELDDLDELADVTPYVRETAKVGRNDPCPCGSGKKYKKCCGAS